MGCRDDINKDTINYMIKSKIKSFLLLISGIISVTLVSWIYLIPVYKLCTWGGQDHYGCFDLSKLAVLFFIPLALVIFLLSLITYRMKEEVFQSWLKVAYWMVPLIILATIFVQFLPKEHGFFAMDALVYLIIIAPLYAIFVLLSLWKIVRTYLRTKNS